ncbi:hypothetical protein DE4585_01573 [Mycobacteroides salmoniphilum]|uniref:Uncharacterized protein n=1 Tax=Mycobacteroides salmoniphilum TaxID=404941 RepID=A0A4R8S0R3_9MYCO|nr:hypothetical protein [Mycobacteroides salmoniphilum]TDZ75213.1 hypothetical protein DE4586_03103 [Mycobacteroides salmoniphilum]TDZ82781.1 hypothetical protein DE4585_01573 [Mycobacteroides salmoniphilum]TDZ83731.1 hypothetical protein DE4587_02644 [Mycobacteroides salmoniphilum]
MIQLAGARFGVGKATARSMWVATSIACIDYALLIALFWLSIIRGSSKYGDWISAVIQTGLLFYFIAIVITGIVSVTLYGSASQEIESPPAEKMIRRAFDALKTFLLRVPLLQFMPVFMLFPIALVSFPDNPRSGVSIVVALIWSFTFTAHAVFIVKRASAMYQSANTKVDGHVELYRDFDWTQLDLDDEKQFRKRYLSRTWKHPSYIGDSGEAVSYALRARKFKLGYSIANACIALIYLVGVNQLIIKALQHTARPSEGLSAWANFWYVIAPTVALLFATIPMFIQHHIGNLDVLSKRYEDHGNSLTEPVKPITLTGAARRYATPLPVWRRQS